jgi:hypothetical protein
MDTREEIETHGGVAAGANVAAVKRVFDRVAEADALAGVEELLGFSHDDVAMRAYTAHAASSGELLHGKEEVFDFFRRTKEDGYGVRLRMKAADLADDDTVLVRGSIRVARPDGSFAETSVRWRIHFSDGLVDEIGWEPRAGD